MRGYNAYVLPILRTMNISAVDNGVDASDIIQMLSMKLADGNAGAKSFPASFAHP